MLPRTLLPWFLLLVLLTSSPIWAKIRLLTGDSSNMLHAHESTVEDLSPDGDLVLFTTGPPISGSTPGIVEGGLYLRRISNNTLTFVGDNSVTHAGVVEASMSDNGNIVAWRSSNGNVYWRNVGTDDTRLVTTGAAAHSYKPILRSDGRVLAFVSDARDLIANTSKLPDSGRSAVYSYDSLTSTIAILSLSSTGAALPTGVGFSAPFNEFDFSADGKFVFFSSTSPNVHPARASVDAGLLCVYRRQLSTGTVLLLNRNASGKVINGNFYTPRCDASGNRVSFFGGNLGLYAGPDMIDSVPSNLFNSDLYVKEISSAKVWWVSRTTDNVSPNGAFASFPAISGDGSTVSFASTSTNFVTGETDPSPGISATDDIFSVYLAASGATTTTLITRSPNGSGNVSYRFGPLLPKNGSFVAFSTSQLAAMFGTGSNDTIYYQGISVDTPALPPVPKTPEIDVIGFTDGKSKSSFGTVAVGKKSKSKSYTIRNVGKANLTKLKLSISGSARKDYIVTKLKGSTLAPGGNDSFKITFKPKSKGTRNAVLKITSNDANESPFDIELTGKGR